MLLFVDAVYGRLLSRRQMKKTIIGILQEIVFIKCIVS